MADKKLSALTALADIPDNALVYIVSGGASYKSTKGELLGGLVANVVPKTKSFFNTGVNSTAAFASLVNAAASFTIAPGELYIFRVSNPITDSSITPVYRFILRNVGAGDFGTGGISVSSANIEIISVTTPTVSDILTFEPQIENLGEIGTDLVSDVVNALDPAVTIQEQEDGFRLFTGTRDDVEFFYMFLAAGGVYGDGEEQTVEGDFVLLGANIPNPEIPNLQQVVDAGPNVVDAEAAVTFTEGGSVTSIAAGDVTVSGDVYTNSHSSGANIINDAVTGESTKFGSNAVVYELEGNDVTLNFETPTAPNGTVTIKDVAGANETVAFLSDITGGGDASFLIYRALVSQSSHFQTDGELIVGHDYMFVGDSIESDDFSNVGATDQTDGDIFTATGTTPTDYTNGSNLQDLTASAPTAIELENTIGEVTFSYQSAGSYRINKTGAFPTDETFVDINPANDSGFGGYINGAANDYVSFGDQNGDYGLYRTSMLIMVKQ